MSSGVDEVGGFEPSCCGSSYCPNQGDGRGAGEGKTEADGQSTREDLDTLIYRLEILVRACDNLSLV